MGLGRPAPLHDDGAVDGCAVPLALLVLARRVEGKQVVVVCAGMSGLAVAGSLARAGVRRQHARLK